MQTKLELDIVSALSQDVVERRLWRVVRIRRDNWQTCKGRLVKAGGSAVELSPATRESRNQKVVTCSLTQAMCFDAQYVTEFVHPF